MSNVFRKRGFDAHKQEEARRKKEAENRTGKLWRFFLEDGEEDVPLRFLTEEPILFYEHSIKEGGRWTNATCTGEDCEYCDSGKSSYKGAWLIVDGREREIDEKKDGKKTGKKKVIKDQIRLYVRGSKDIAKLDRYSKKFGLTSRPWFATKTGSDTSTSYELDRGEIDELSKKELANLIAKLPDALKNHYDGSMDSLYDIVEAQIFDDVELRGSEVEEDKKSSKTKSKSSKRSKDEDEDDDEDLEDGVESTDDEEEEDVKPKKTLGKKKSAPSKSEVKKSSTPAKKKSVFKRR